MARIHIGQSNGPNQYFVVVHAPVPTGNNAAGVSWQTAMANAGFATTSMVVGNGPGQISQAEANQVQNGSLIETSGTWGDNPAWTNAERQADLTLRAQQMVDAATADYAVRLKYFGFTVT